MERIEPWIGRKVGDIMSLAGAAGGIHCFRFVFFLKVEGGVINEFGNLVRGPSIKNPFRN